MGHRGTPNGSLQVEREEPGSWTLLDLPTPYFFSLLPTSSDTLSPLGVCLWSAWSGHPSFQPTALLFKLRNQLKSHSLESPWQSWFLLESLTVLCIFFYFSHSIAFKNFFSLIEGLFPTQGRDGCCQPYSLPEVQGPSKFWCLVSAPF